MSKFESPNPYKVPCIIASKGKDGEWNYFGPFENGVAATVWGHQNLKGFEWYWEELNLVNQPEQEA